MTLRTIHYKPSYLNLGSGYTKNGVLPTGFVPRSSQFDFHDPETLIKYHDDIQANAEKAVRNARHSAIAATAARKLADKAGIKLRSAVKETMRYQQVGGVPSYQDLDYYSTTGPLPMGSTSNWFHTDPELLRNYHLNLNNETAVRNARYGAKAADLGSIVNDATSDSIENWGFSSIVHAASGAAHAAARAAAAAKSKAEAVAHAAAVTALKAEHDASAKIELAARAAAAKTAAAAHAAGKMASSAGNWVAHEASAVGAAVSKAANALKGPAQKLYCDNVHQLCDKALDMVGDVGVEMCEPLAAEMAGVCESIGLTIPPPFGEIMGTACAATAGDLVLDGCNNAIHAAGQFGDDECTAVLKKPFCPPSDSFAYRGGYW